MAAIIVHPKDVVRFWKFAGKKAVDECWEWRGLRGKNQYGYLTIGSLKDSTRRGCLAHRLSWTIHHGQIPDGLSACHACDNPPCVNPAHLWLGTQGDNNRDALAKGRNTPGWRKRPEEHPLAKLSPEIVAHIRATYQGKWGEVVALGKQYGVSHVTIGKVLRKESWNDRQPQSI